MRDAHHNNVIKILPENPLNSKTSNKMKGTNNEINLYLPDIHRLPVSPRLFICHCLVYWSIRTRTSFTIASSA